MGMMPGLSRDAVDNLNLDNRRMATSVFAKVSFTFTAGCLSDLSFYCLDKLFAEIKKSLVFTILVAHYIDSLFLSIFPDIGRHR